MNYAQFLRDVQESGSLVSEEETEGAVASVLMALAQILPGKQLEALSMRLPPEAMVYLRRAGSEPDPFFDSQLFLGWVVSTLDATADHDKTAGGLDLTASYSGEEAVRRAQCVFSVLKRQMECQEQEELATFLPDEVSAWFLSA
jgi:uncharacterized protein (DUF2267 family)